MPNVVRFTLSTARDLNVPGAGFFHAGVLDIDANDLKLVARTRYLTDPYGAVEVGIVDSATPKPALPAVPAAPAADPYPQYVTDADIANPASGPMVALKAASVAVGKEEFVSAFPVPPVARPKGKGIIASFAAGHGFAFSGNTGAGSTLDDTSTGALAGQSVKMVTDGAGNNALLDRYVLPKTLDATGKLFRIWIKVDDTQKLRDLVFFAGGDSLASFFRFNLQTSATALTENFIQPGEWTPITIPWNVVQTGGTPNRAAITSVRLRANDHATGPVTVNVGGIDLVDTPTEGVVSFTFDDSYRSDYTKARPILGKYGWAATSYLINDYIDSSTLTNRLSLEQVRDLHRVAGWDIEAHAYDFASHNARFTSMTDAQLRVEYRKIIGWFADHDLPIPTHIAYPGGNFNPTVRGVTRTFFSTSRLIYDRTQETLPPVDPHRVRTLNVTAAVAPSTVTAAITAAVQEKHWLVLVFHEIVDANPAEAQVSTANLQTFADHCATVGAQVLPVSQALKTLNTTDTPQDYLASQALTVGEATLPRLLANQAISQSSGTMRLAYFTARRSEVVAQIRVASISAAGATPTLCRVGVYEVDPATGDLTLVASTANDATLFSTANTAYTKALAAPFTKQAGKRYAVGTLVVTGATAPTVLGLGAVGGVGSEGGQGPRIGAGLGGQTDLPSTVTATSLANSGPNMPYAVLLP